MFTSLVPTSTSSILQRENLYKEVLYTITHKLGNAQNSQQGNLANHFLQMQQKKPNALSAALAPLWQTVTSDNKNKQPSKDDLLTYAQEAFDVDDETHAKLMEEVKEEKVAILKIGENWVISCLLCNNRLGARKSCSPSSFDFSWALPFSSLLLLCSTWLSWRLTSWRPRTLTAIATLSACWVYDQETPFRPNDRRVKNHPI